ncbi:hypothetical protein EPO44_06225 [bacterium]|nr:MAG: hypothetical protein EPO44_06225 [bacterium]
MAEWIIVILTLVIAFFTFLVWKVYERIAWLTGAMETHSDLMLRIEARRGINGEPIKLVWWDPTIEKIPTRKQHGEEVDLSTIYIYLPMEMRQNKPGYRDKLKSLFNLP